MRYLRRSQFALSVITMLIAFLALSSPAPAAVRVENPSTGAKGVQANVNPAFFQLGKPAGAFELQMVKLNNNWDTGRKFQWSVRLDTGYDSVCLDLYVTYSDGTYISQTYAVSDPFNYRVRNMKIAETVSPGAGYWNVYYDAGPIRYNTPWYLSSAGTYTGTQVQSNAAPDETGYISNIQVFTSGRVWSPQTSSSWPNCYMVDDSPFVLGTWVNGRHYYEWQALLET